MKRKVVIITDCIDVALLEIRGSIFFNALKDDFEIEPIVPVDNYNIVNTAFLVNLIAEAYPDGTIINVVVNPLKLRTERIVGRTEKKNIIFEGTNTGAFGWLIENYGCKELYEIHDFGFVPFGGKFVHAPAVGKLASGVPMHELGTEFEISKIRDVERTEGTVVHVDNFGNIKFLGDLSDAKDGDKYHIYIDEKKYEAVFWRRMMEREDGELVIYPGSSFGFPELGIVRGNAAESFDIFVGDKIIIKKCKE